MAATRIVVAGGSGFLGSKICKSAVARGWSVTSLSRSGEPQWDTVSSFRETPEWANSVEWAKADILKPSTYKIYLKDATAVIHSMGILLEADYKSVIRGEQFLIRGLQRALSSSKLGSQGPLQRNKGEEHKSKERDAQWTYELMNRDSAIALAQECSCEHIPTFVYISAAAGAPILPSRYITTKRDAEAVISSIFPEMRTILMRPPFMYDTTRKFTLPIALGGMIGSQLNTLLGGRLQFMGTMTEKPLQVDLVGEAVIEAISDDAINGVVGTKNIDSLATKAWRRSMLL